MIKYHTFIYQLKFKRLSSNRGHRSKKHGFEKNAFKILSIAYM